MGSQLSWSLVKLAPLTGGVGRRERRDRGGVWLACSSACFAGDRGVWLACSSACISFLYFLNRLLLRSWPLHESSKYERTTTAKGEGELWHKRGDGRWL